MTEDFKRKLTAILSADVVGYSRLMGEDEEDTVLTLNKYREIIFNLIEKNNGRVIDSPGDNVLAEFASVVDAVRCGVQIQEDLKGYNNELLPNRKMEFRIGINTGDVIQDGDRIYGDGVNVAARIESLADAGGICVSSSAYDQVKKKLNYDYEHLGEYEVKNIEEPVSVYKLLMVPKAADKLVEEKKISGWKFNIRNTSIVLIIIIAGILVWKFYPGQPVEQAPKTIAVLPFDDYSAEKDQEHFVLGLSEEILNSLTQIPGLTVTAKTSSFYFKDKDKSFQEIADTLGVEHILEGSVRKDENNLRITAQLIKTDDGSHLWSETYNRELKDIFTIQEDIANTVAEKLKITLGVGQTLKQLGGTANEEAYELYLIGKGLSSREASLWIQKQALDSFDGAIALDPGFALAWIGKSRRHFWFASWGPADRASMQEEAGKNAARKAIELEPNLAEAYFLFGSIHNSRGDYIEAEKAYRKGMELTTESKDYHESRLAGHYTVVGYLRKAVELHEEMLRNDPLQRLSRDFYIIYLALIGDMERAEKEYESGKIIFGDDDFGSSIMMEIARIGTKSVLYRNETINEEIEETENRMVRRVGSHFFFEYLPRKYLESPEEGLEELHRFYSSANNISTVQVMNIALLAAFMGDTDLAIEAIEKASSMSRSNFWYMWFPVMKDVRQLPKFKDLMREVGLVAYWKEYGWPDLCRPVGDNDFECD